MNDNLNLKKKLSKLAFDVTQNCSTERAFSGEFYDFFEDGTYHCICCEEKLFSSNHKFLSKSGKFFKAIDDNVIKYTEDNTGMTVEVSCNRCNAHLGHVFDDGPLHQQEILYKFCIFEI